MKGFQNLDEAAQWERNNEGDSGKHGAEYTFPSLWDDVGLEACSFLGQLLVVML